MTPRPLFLCVFPSREKAKNLAFLFWNPFGDFCFSFYLLFASFRFFLFIFILSPTASIPITVRLEQKWQETTFFIFIPTG